MIDAEKQYLLLLWERNVCPYCGKAIPQGQRVGTGRRSDGGFCSLDCYTNYNVLELIDRLRLLENRISDEIRE